MTAHGSILCSHCSLPVGLRAMERAVNGESCAFCCYGCCIAFQVKSGKSEEWEAAWLLIQLGVGGFLSMNIMMFSLLLYSDAFTASMRACCRGFTFCCGSSRRRRSSSSAGPYLRETWLNAHRRGA